MWLSRASQRACINLDFYTMSKHEIRNVFRRYTKGADVIIVEGNKGLYDGMDVDGSDCSAALAGLLGLPVILLLDVSGITRGVAPLLHGYQTFNKNVRIAGVVLNKVGGKRHEGKLRDAVARYTKVPVLGAIHRTHNMEIEERHIGLVPSNEEPNAQDRIDDIAQVITESVDVEKIIDLAVPLDEDSFEPSASLSSHSADIRIGIARDDAFSFYYPDDIEAMQHLGATLVYFDTLRDTALPRVDALFFGGGFPELYLNELENNATLKSDIKEFVDKGFPVYAECGGLMYLCRDITYRGSTRSMVGALKANVKMGARPIGRGYVRLEETSRHPWPVVNEAARKLPAHEFHYSQLENLDDNIEFAYRVTRGVGIRNGYDGLIYRNTLANYAHHRNVGQNHWVERFIAHVKHGKHDSDAKSGTATS